MLRQVLATPKARRMGRVLVTCDEHNVPSERTILRNSGVLEDIVSQDDGKPNKKRFWINLG